MTPTVREFMNPKLVYLPEGTRPEVARNFILKFGITAVPVLDHEHRPIGSVTLRDLNEGAPVEDAGVQVPTVAVDATIDMAARALASGGHHSLVVIDPEGHAVGILSALDVVRALAGLEPHHPARVAPGV